jgi:hypothetical protein
LVCRLEIERKLFYERHHILPLQAHGLNRRVAREQSQQEQATQFALHDAQERLRIMSLQW